VVYGIEQRLHFLLETGLGYLTLDRDYTTLSGGEAQRVRLATQLAWADRSDLRARRAEHRLHPHDNERLLSQLRELRDRGNTVVVVEHDERHFGPPTRFWSWPRGGVEGGYSSSRVLRAMRGAGGKGLADGGLPFAKDGSDKGRRREVARWRMAHRQGGEGAQPARHRRPVSSWTPHVRHGRLRSGKSSLVNDVLAAAAARRLNGAKVVPGRHRHIENLEFFEKLVRVDQEPIGRSPRSNPATFVGLLDILRDLFAQVPLAKVRGYKASRFSFNVRAAGAKGARATASSSSTCSSWPMPMPLHELRGRRFNRETLEILFHGRSIAMSWT